jgi:hypothetical protein
MNMEQKKATKEQIRQALLNAIKEPYKICKLGDDNCLWPAKCKCQDCDNYHPFFSPLIGEDKK